MKKQVISLIAASLIIGVAIVSVISCSKTEQEKVNQQGTITHFSPSQEMVEPTIKTFIQRFEDYKAGYKTGGEDIKLGEAIWTLEASVNYEYQGQKENLRDFENDSLFVSVDVFIGENNEYYLSEEDALELYSDIIDFTGDKLNTENAELLVADLEYSSVDNGNANMKLITVSGKGGFPDPCTLHSDDYWYAAFEAGRCNGLTGGVGKDASNKINTLLNCTQANGYWTSIEAVYDITQYFDPNLNPCFWGMGYQGSWDDCISPTEIDYWYDMAVYVIDEETPYGKEYIDCLFKDEYLLNTNDTWFHYFDHIRYGVLNEGDPD
ncbi:MAG: hypothetical protein K9G76_09380 [Bacteroidales bacterium]|nr:hypothetical protein [Bacteroidales bacterium]MCF8403763.1 hypothetical protein [Bacteroidales bacterium]